MNDIYGTPARPEELEFIRQKYAILGPQLVAKALGRSECFAIERAREQGISYEGARIHLPFIRKYAPEKGCAWCARELGYHPTTIQRLAKANGIPGAKQKGVIRWRKPKCEG